MQTRRNFIQRLAVAAGVTTVLFSGPIVAGKYAEHGGDLQVVPGQQPCRDFNSPYTGQHLNRIAFPIGGIGAGMVCMEGTGAISHVSVRNTPGIHHEPFAFATLCIKGKDGNTARILEGPMVENPPIKDKVPGSSLFVPFRLEPGEKRVITLKFCWFAPETDLRKGADQSPDGATCSSATTHMPWYAGKFRDINQLSIYWSENYNRLREKTALFSSSFFGSTLPPEVLEAVVANLSILKSPTVLRQTDGRLWAWEGCRDNSGCCSGSCSHVWNYAQAIPHLFPSLERTLRENEFLENQSGDGFQIFRASLPIRPTNTGKHPAVDGQLGGIECKRSNCRGRCLEY